MESDQVKVLKEKAKEAIDIYSPELYELNKSVWENPELGLQERFAHDQLTEFLADQGFDVIPHYTLDTAFRAECGEDGGLTIGLISEYDALPEVGHACGHNLIAESGVATALGIDPYLSGTYQPRPKVKIVLLGTPAEETTGGKISMIKNGCFKDLDFCMMVHPSSVDVLKPVILASESATITYKGHAAHAAAFPWEGINALDAAVMAYTSISALRQQMKPTWHVNLIISKGGVKPNIIPDRAQLQCYIRAMTDSNLEVLKEKVKNCFEAAASATGCKVSMEWETATRYSHLETNNTLAELYQANAESLGVSFPPEAKFSASTDMGNVSHLVPSIHPMYSIGTTAPNHSHAFTTAAATEEAHEKTLIASKAMAMTAIDVLCKQDFMGKVRIDFKQPNEGEN
ncbi:unnamed protein product [Pocillopora meandrina]|uniref:Peptidase M20 domain-containing protein 2 n=1 Tax=Pocillopora meandrina TaxID=46732 RepID=A0AAU9W2R7_9CNID|nr:unnamed protein product [Pocillopora meandrina]